MGNLPRIANQRPDFWQIFGHSYTAGAVGTMYQTGRFDALFRAALDVEWSSGRNHSKSGALLTLEDRSSGGWGRIFNELQPVPRTAPYSPGDGAKLFCFGINDMGILGTASMVQMQAAYCQALRAVVSRARASSLFDDNSATTLAYGAGFSSQVSTNFTGTTFRQATVTTSATITITLPADYTGQPISICFIGMQGVAGGTVTFTGTAGVTGTLSTSNIMPSATGSRCPVVRRITNLTTANAGQTIICSATAFDAGGFVWFDSWWIESYSPPLVLWCNVNRLTVAGYAGFVNWTGTEAQQDQNVRDWNAAVRQVIEEFDDMVQEIPLDGLVNKQSAVTFDGIHLNEKGAALAVDAMLLAVEQSVAPSLELGQTASYNVPSDRTGPRGVPRVSGGWYTSGPTIQATTYTAVAQDLFATPFEVTSARDRYINFCVNRIDVVAAATTSVRWGIYNDCNLRGYPQFLEFEATSAGAFTITTGAGVKVNPASPTAGSFIWIPDPGQYWLCIKFATVGVAHTFAILDFKTSNPLLPALSTTGAPVVADRSPTGYKLTAQGTGALTTQFPTGGVLSDVVPSIGIKVN